MRRTVFPMVLMLALVVLTASCDSCYNETTCRDKYGLIKSSECTEEDCGGVPGPPGPTIYPPEQFHSRNKGVGGVLL